jgi:hypothetical protein
MPNKLSHHNQPHVGSSQNARKRGFHSIALLPGEDEQEVIELHQEICHEYAVSSELDRFLVTKLVQNILMHARIQNYKQSVVNAALFSDEARREFRRAAQINPLDFLDDLPDELLCYDPMLIKRGMQVALALIEIGKLLQTITASNAAVMLASISTHSPALLNELQLLGLSNPSDAARFMGLRYGKQHVSDNLNAISKELIKANRVAILWCQNEAKYKIIIDSLKAKASLELIKDPNIARHETGSLNKILKIRAELQIKKDAKALEAQAIDVTDQNLGGSLKGATGASKEGSKAGTGAKGLGNYKGSPEVTDVAETTRKQV